jgi:hypothetical protein
LSSTSAAYDGRALPDRSYTAEEVDEALTRLMEPGRLAHAQDVVAHAAPTLQRVLAEALAEGGWFGEAHDAEVNRVCGEPNQDERVRAVATLVAEQTRIGMFVGAAVGFELAQELIAQRDSAILPDGIELRDSTALPDGGDGENNQPPTDEDQKNADTLSRPRRI